MKYKCYISKDGKRLNANEEIEYLLDIDKRKRQILLDMQQHTQEMLNNQMVLD